MPTAAVASKAPSAAAPTAATAAPTAAVPTKMPTLDLRPRLEIVRPADANEGTLFEWMVKLDRPKDTPTDLIISLGGTITQGAALGVGLVEYRAVAGGAWVPLPADGRITLPAGSNGAAVRVHTKEDGDSLSDTMTLIVSTADGGVANANANIADTAGVLDISDPADVLRVLDARVGEGGLLCFVVTRREGNAAHPHSLKIDYASAADLSASTNDFTAVQGTLSFLRGERTKHVLVRTTRDAAHGEAAEQLSLVLTNARSEGMTAQPILAKAVATGTIVDSDDGGEGGWDDGAGDGDDGTGGGGWRGGGASAGFGAEGAMTYEGLPLTFVIKRAARLVPYAQEIKFHTAVHSSVAAAAAAAAAARRVTVVDLSLTSAVERHHEIVDFATTSTTKAMLQSGFATQEDFEDTSGSLIFFPGETSKSVEIQTIVSSDVEGDETFFVMFESPYGAPLCNATGTIVELGVPTPPPTTAKSGRLIEDTFDDLGNIGSKVKDGTPWYEDWRWLLFLLLLLLCCCCFLCCCCWCFCCWLCWPIICKRRRRDTCRDFCACLQNTFCCACCPPLCFNMCASCVGGAAARKEGTPVFVAAGGGGYYAYIAAAMAAPPIVGAPLMLTLLSEDGEINYGSIAIDSETSIADVRIDAANELVDLPPGYTLLVPSRTCKTCPIFMPPPAVLQSSDETATMASIFAPEMQALVRMNSIGILAADGTLIGSVPVFPHTTLANVRANIRRCFPTVSDEYVFVRGPRGGSPEGEGANAAAMARVQRSIESIAGTSDSHIPLGALAVTPKQEAALRVSTLAPALVLIPTAPMIIAVCTCSGTSASDIGAKERVYGHVVIDTMTTLTQLRKKVVATLPSAPRCFAFVAETSAASKNGEVLAGTRSRVRKTLERREKAWLHTPRILLLPTKIQLVNSGGVPIPGEAGILELAEGDTLASCRAQIESRRPDAIPRDAPFAFLAPPSPVDAEPTKAKPMKKGRGKETAAQLPLVPRPPLALSRSREVLTPAIAFGPTLMVAWGDDVDATGALAEGVVSVVVHIPCRAQPPSAVSISTRVNRNLLTMVTGGKYGKGAHRQKMAEKLRADDSKLGGFRHLGVVNVSDLSLSDIRSVVSTLPHAPNEFDFLLGTSSSADADRSASLSSYGDLEPLVFVGQTGADGAFCVIPRTAESKRSAGISMTDIPSKPIYAGGISGRSSDGGDGDLHRGTYEHDNLLAKATSGRYGAGAHRRKIASWARASPGLVSLPVIIIRARTLRVVTEGGVLVATVPMTHKMTLDMVRFETEQQLETGVSEFVFVAPVSSSTRRSAETAKKEEIKKRRDESLRHFGGSIRLASSTNAPITSDGLSSATGAKRAFGDFTASTRSLSVSEEPTSRADAYLPEVRIRPVNIIVVTEDGGLIGVIPSDPFKSSINGVQSRLLRDRAKLAFPERLPYAFVLTVASAAQQHVMLASSFRPACLDHNSIAQDDDELQGSYLTPVLIASTLANIKVLSEGGVLLGTIPLANKEANLRDLRNEINAQIPGAPKEFVYLAPPLRVSGGGVDAVALERECGTPLERAEEQSNLVADVAPLGIIRLRAAAVYIVDDHGRALVAPAIVGLDRPLGSTDSTTMEEVVDDARASDALPVGVPAEFDVVHAAPLLNTDSSGTPFDAATVTVVVEHVGGSDVFIGVLPIDDAMNLPELREAIERKFTGRATPAAFSFIEPSPPSALVVKGSSKRRDETVVEIVVPRNCEVDDVFDFDTTKAGMVTVALPKGALPGATLTVAAKTDGTSRIIAGLLNESIDASVEKMTTVTSIGAVVRLRATALRIVLDVHGDGSDDALPLIATVPIDPRTTMTDLRQRLQESQAVDAHKSGVAMTGASGGDTRADAIALITNRAAGHVPSDFAWLEVPVGGVTTAMPSEDEHARFAIRWCTELRLQPLSITIVQVIGEKHDLQSAKVAAAMADPSDNRAVVLGSVKLVPNDSLLSLRPRIAATLGGHVVPADFEYMHVPTSAAFRAVAAAKAAKATAKGVVKHLLHKSERVHADAELQMRLYELQPMRPRAERRAVAARFAPIIFIRPSSLLILDGSGKYLGTVPCKSDTSLAEVRACVRRDIAGAGDFTFLLPPTEDEAARMSGGSPKDRVDVSRWTPLTDEDEEATTSAADFLPMVAMMPESVAVVDERDGSTIARMPFTPETTLYDIRRALPNGELSTAGLIFLQPRAASLGFRLNSDGTAKSSEPELVPITGRQEVALKVSVFAPTIVARIPDGNWRSPAAGTAGRETIKAVEVHIVSESNSNYLGSIAFSTDEMQHTSLADLRARIDVECTDVPAKFAFLPSARGQCTLAFGPSDDIDDDEHLTVVTSAVVATAACETLAVVKRTKEPSRGITAFLDAWEDAGAVVAIVRSSALRVLDVAGNEIGVVDYRPHAKLSKIRSLIAKELPLAPPDFCFLDNGDGGEVPRRAEHRMGTSIFEPTVTIEPRALVIVDESGERVGSGIVGPIDASTTLSDVRAMITKQLGDVAPPCYEFIRFDALEKFSAVSSGKSSGTRRKAVTRVATRHLITTTEEPAANALVVATPPADVGVGRAGVLWISTPQTIRIRCAETGVVIGTLSLGGTDAFPNTAARTTLRSARPLLRSEFAHLADGRFTFMVEEKSGGGAAAGGSGVIAAATKGRFGQGKHRAQFKAWLSKRASATKLGEEGEEEEELAPPPPLCELVKEDEPSASVLASLVTHTRDLFVLDADGAQPPQSERRRASTMRGPHVFAKQYRRSGAAVLAPNLKLRTPRVIHVLSEDGITHHGDLPILASTTLHDIRAAIVDESWADPVIGSGSMFPASYVFLRPTLPSHARASVGLSKVRQAAHLRSAELFNPTEVPRYDAISPAMDGTLRVAPLYPEIRVRGVGNSARRRVRVWANGVDCGLIEIALNATLKETRSSIFTQLWHTSVLITLRRKHRLHLHKLRFISIPALLRHDHPELVGYQRLCEKKAESRTILLPRWLAGDVNSKDADARMSAAGVIGDEEELRVSLGVEARGKARPWWVSMHVAIPETRSAQPMQKPSDQDNDEEEDHIPEDSTYVDITALRRGLGGGGSGGFGGGGGGGPSESEEEESEDEEEDDAAEVEHAAAAEAAEKAKEEERRALAEHRAAEAAERQAQMEAEDAARKRKAATERKRARAARDAAKQEAKAAAALEKKMADLAAAEEKRKRDEARDAAKKEAEAAAAHEKKMAELAAAEEKRKRDEARDAAAEAKRRRESLALAKGKELKLLRAKIAREEAEEAERKQTAEEEAARLAAEAQAAADAERARLAELAARKEAERQRKAAAEVAAAQAAAEAERARLAELAARKEAEMQRQAAAEVAAAQDAEEARRKTAAREAEAKRIAAEAAAEEARLKAEAAAAAKAAADAAAAAKPTATVRTATARRRVVKKKKLIKKKVIKKVIVKKKVIKKKVVKSKVTKKVVKKVLAKPKKKEPAPEPVPEVEPEKTPEEVEQEVEIKKKRIAARDKRILSKLSIRIDPRTGVKCSKWLNFIPKVIPEGWESEAKRVGGGYVYRLIYVGDSAEVAAKLAASTAGMAKGKLYGSNNKDDGKGDWISGGKVAAKKGKKKKKQAKK